MENLNLLAEIVKQFEEEKMKLNEELASLYKSQAVVGVNQKQLSDKINQIKSEAALITKERIEEYKALWKSLGSNNAPPCPSCFILNGKHSDLQAEPEMRKPEHFRCQECGRWIHAPLP